MPAPTIGIDFGTSTTLVASRVGETPARLIPIGLARNWMPSIAAIDEDGSLVVGEQTAGYSERSVIRSIKTLLGQDAQTLQRVTSAGRAVELRVDDVVISILKDAAQRAAVAGARLDRTAVRMACPANWSAAPRHRLIRLAQQAGINTDITRLLDEPIAAGISWVMNRWHDRGEYPQGRSLVVDYGGGTLDIAVLEVTGSNPPEITVLSALGIPEAGDRLDETIAGELLAELIDGGRVAADPGEELVALVRLAATRLKEALSSSNDHSTPLGGRYDLGDLHYSAGRLEEAFRPQLQRAVDCCFAALRAAEFRRRGADDPTALRGLKEDHLAKDVSSVLLAGGFSRVPAVRSRLVAAFPNTAVEYDTRLQAPEESVVSGLTFEQVVSELNLHRPAFDFIAEVRHPRTGQVLDRIVLYPAFSPLYTPDEVMRGQSLLGHEASFAVPSGLFKAEVSVTCQGLDNKPLDLHVNGLATPSIDLSIDARNSGRFKLYVDGRILLTGTTRRILRVERWPVMHGKSSPISFVEERRSWEDDLRPGWWGERV